MLDAIGIVSRDLGQTLDFYKILGLDLRPSEEGSDHHEAVTSSGLRVMVDSVALMKQINPQWEQTKGGAIALGFVQKRPEDVDSVYQKIVAAGFPSVKAPWDAFWGQRYATVSDPDGNPVDLFANL